MHNNLHQRAAAASILSKIVTTELIVISLIHEPWTFAGGLGSSIYIREKHYFASANRTKACTLEGTSWQ